jgi:hypothetical protein
MRLFVVICLLAAGQIPANLILDTPQAAVPVVGSTVTRQVRQPQVLPLFYFFLFMPTRFIKLFSAPCNNNMLSPSFEWSDLIDCVMLSFRQGGCMWEIYRSEFRKMR